MEKIVAVTTSSFAEYDKAPLEILRKAGYKVVTNSYKRRLRAEEVLKLCKDAVGIIAGTESLDSSVLSKLPYLKAISRCGAGVENIDLNFTGKHKIKIYNTPDAPTQAVAELTVGLILNLLRKINQMDYGIKNGKWEKLMGNLLAGKKIGIIGFGRIGRRVAELLRAFNCEIAYHDPFVKNKLLSFKRIAKEKLLAWADIVTIHASTGEMVLGAKELKLMRKGAWLVNVSRGMAIKEGALCDALRRNLLRGAALDVFSQEPYNGKLTKLTNVVLTSHIGSYAKESRITMEEQAVENLLKGLKICKII